MKNLFKLLLSVLLAPAHTLYADEEVNVKAKTENEEVETADETADESVDNEAENNDDSESTDDSIDLDNVVVVIDDVDAEDRSIIVYVVQAGDNLSTIAARFGTTVSVIKEVNDIDDETLLRI